MVGSTTTSTLSISLKKVMVVLSPFNSTLSLWGLRERIWNKVGAPLIVDGRTVLFMFYSGHLVSTHARVEAAIAAHRAETALQLEEARKQTLVVV